jgi:hypothetical protein
MDCVKAKTLQLIGCKSKGADRRAFALQPAPLGFIKSTGWLHGLGSFSDLQTSYFAKMAAVTFGGDMGSS